MATKIPETLLAFTDNSSNDANASKHGYLKKLSGDAAQFMNGEGDWITPVGAGDVVGPAGSTDNQVAIFDGATGKLIKDSGLTLVGNNTGDQDLSPLLVKASNLSDIADAVASRANLGLGNVDNVSDAGKPVSTAQQTALDLKVDDTEITNIDNTSDADKPVSTAQQTALDLKATVTALDLKAPLASPAFSGTPTGISKAHVGLGSVDNTADSAKSVLNATEWNGAVKTSSTSAPSGGADGDIHFKYVA